ncbi:hypothetical protein Tco_0676789 [Tanacetum coccineum]
MVVFKVLKNQLQQFINMQISMDSDDQKTNHFFTEYTLCDAQKFQNILISLMDSIEKVIAERGLYTKTHDNRVHERMMQTLEGMISKDASEIDNNVAGASHDKDNVTEAFKQDEDKYVNNIIQLEAKNKDLENIVCKMGKSSQTLRMLTNEQSLYRENKQKMGLGYTDPCPLGQAIACHPKLYDVEVLGLHYVKPDVYDTVEILNDAEESQVKMKEKQFQFNYENINNLYDMFVPQTELSPKQEYFSIPPTSNNSSESKDVPSESPVLKMPKESRLLKMFDTMGDAITGLHTRINNTLLQDAERRWLSDSQNELRKFYKTDVISMSRYLYKNLKQIKEELIEESYVEIKNNEEIELFSKESKDSEKFCNDVVENAFADEVKGATTRKLNVFDKENCDFGSKVTHLEKIIAQKTKDFDDVKLELSNRTAKFEAYFEKLENTKVVLERQLARKVDDSKAEKDQFLKEINHLRTQLKNLKGKSLETKFDKPLILGKPPLTKNEKDHLLKQITFLESKLASQDLHSCQKEYHELRISNKLKSKKKKKKGFDSLNRTKRKTNVSKSSKPKVSVSEKIHTGEFSKPFLKRVSQFTTYSLQKDRKFSKKSQSFKTPTPQKVFKTSASNAKNQVFETPNSRFTPVKQVWRLSKKTQTFETPNSQVVVKTSALKDKNQVFVTPHSRFTPIIMVNEIPLNYVDDVPVVEPNQHDDVPVVPELVLEDEDEDPMRWNLRREDLRDEDVMEIDFEG